MTTTIHKIYLYLLLVAIILLLFPWAQGCTDSAAPKKPAELAADGVTKTIPKGSKALDDKQDCPRGEPEPLLAKSTFTRVSRLEAIEEYEPSQNISLTIRHFGCAHFAEGYHFKVQGKIYKENEWRRWMTFIADQLEKLPFRKDAEEQIKTMVSTLRTQTKAKATYTYNTEINISDAESVSFSVKAIGENLTELVVVYQFAL